MSFEQLDTLEPLLKELDERQARINDLKRAHPDAYSRILNNWPLSPPTTLIILRGAPFH